MNDPATPLARLKERRGYSFRELAFLTGLSAGYLCRVANGRRQLSPEAALTVARVLGVNPQRLVTDDGDER